MDRIDKRGLLFSTFAWNFGSGFLGEETTFEVLHAYNCYCFSVARCTFSSFDSMARTLPTSFRIDVPKLGLELT